MNNLNIIGDGKRKSSFDPDLAGKVNKEFERKERRKKLDELKRKKPEEAGAVETVSGNLTLEFSLEDLTDSYRAAGIPYRNGIHTFDLYKELLPSKTQDEHAEHRKQSVENNTSEFYTPSYPELNALISALERNKDNPQYQEQIEQARQFLKQQMLNNCLITLTRIRCNPQNKKDKVIHNYKQQDQYTIELDSFIGPDGHILNPSTENALTPLQALLDTKQSLQEINSIYKWLTDVDAYIWRLNSQVNNPKDAVAGFDANSNRANLDCSRDPVFSDTSLGVRVAKLK